MVGNWLLRRIVSMRLQPLQATACIICVYSKILVIKYM
jgi:hypothetical protein